MKNFIYLSLVVLAFMHIVHGVAYAQEVSLSAAVPKSREEISLSFAPLVKKISPAVVNIYTKRTVTTMAGGFSPLMNDPFFGQFFQQRGFGVPRQRLENSLGSGVIVEETGLVVTNAHVVKDAEEITIVLQDGREFPAALSLLDPPSDLAVLRLQQAGDDPLPKLPYVTLQPSETLEVGDLVLAIGNPFGVGQTVTSGIVSALARSSLDINDFNFFIQTDAAINPGNSGGPLLSMSGGVIGINTAIFSRDGGSLGIGFAIPSEMVATVIAAEKSGQKQGKNGIVRPWFGIESQDVTAEIAASLGMKRPKGALIKVLNELSPAKIVGLKVGDVVTAVNGHEVRDSAELRFRLAMLPMGDTAALSYQRAGKEAVAEVKAIAPPDSPERDVRVIKGQNPLSGATISNVNPAVLIEMGLKGEIQGVVVTDVDQRSIASRLVKSGDVLMAVNKKPVESTKEAQKLLSKPARGWILTIYSNGQQRTLVVR